MSKIGIYPGTFDPMTNGHLNIIQRSLKVVDKLIIGVADNLNKKPLLSIDELYLNVHLSLDQKFPDIFQFLTS